MNAISPSARFQVEPTPINSPGFCFLCRTTTPDNAPYVNTGVSHIWWHEPLNDVVKDGVVYICASCVSDLFGTLQLSDTSVSGRIAEARRQGYEAGIMAAKKEISDHAASFVDSVLASGSQFTVVSGSDSVPAEKPAKDEPAKQRSASKSTNAGGSADVDVTSKGSDGISSDRTDATDLSEFFGNAS